MFQPIGPRALRARLLCGLALASLAAATPGLTQAQIQAPGQLPGKPVASHAVNLPAGELDAALLALAAQTHTQLLYSPAVTAGRRVSPIKGNFTVEQALSLLLANSGVVVTRAGPDVLVLRTPAQAATQAGLVPIVRTATLAQPTGAGGGRPFDVEPDAAMRGGSGPDAAAGASMPPNTVAEIRVTGSHIRGGQPASPVITLDRDGIDRSGHATLSEALAALPQNFGGVATEGTVTTGADRLGRNASFATGVNLRGLGADATLVLINGRRMAGSGLFGDFSDVSSIPTSAVSRVEILLDGASALYGSDAVGGVVNVILRTDFEGAETRLFAGFGTEGGPFQAQVSELLGHHWSTGHVLLAYEHQQRDALPGADRAYTSSADLRPLGGTDRRQSFSFPGNILQSTPAGTVPGWAIPAGQAGVGLHPSDLLAGVVNLSNQRQGEDTLPRQTLDAGYLSASQSLGDRLEISGDARYSYRAFTARLGPPTSSFTVSRNNPFFVSPIGATAETVSYSFVNDLPNPRNTGSAESLGGSLGGTLRLSGDWRAEGYVTFAEEIEETRNSGLLNSTAVSEAVGSVPDRPQTPFSTAINGFFNPFAGVPGANSASVLNYIGSGYTSGHSRAQVSSANLQADGTVWELPGGPLKLAVGAQARRETLERVGVNYTSTVAPTAIIPTDVGRNVVSAYAEVRAPLFGPENRRPGFERLEVSLAGRVERYDDVGSTANPQAGVLWSPADGLTLRGTYGTSFRAPALKEVHDPALNSPSLLPVGSTSVLTLLLSGGNPNLKPETAKSWTVGADLSPARWPGLKLSATLFDVRFNNRIDRPVQSNILNALSDPTLSSFITRISPATNAADRALIAALLASPATSTAQGSFPPEAYGAIADNRYVNTTALHVRGIDLSGSYHFDFGADRITLASNASWLTTYDQEITPTAPTVSRLGIADFPVEFRSRLTADWTRDRLTAGAAFNYISAYNDALGIRIADQPTFDLQLRVAPAETGLWRGIAATLNVRNVFDRAPPFYNSAFGVGYDAANADPIGRFVSVQFTRAW